MRDGPSAAILLIGNELLSGRVEDANLAFLAGELWSLGVRVRRAEVVRDEIDVIADAVRGLSSAHHHVLTTGGIGPTHDDVTIAGVARAFGRDVVLHPDLEGRIRAHFGADVQEAHLRMARAPAGARLVGGASGWPTLLVENVIILPGVPSILRKKFIDLKSHFSGTPIHRAVLGLRSDESTLAPLLDALCRRFPEVEIGSYPEPERVLVTIEGCDRAAVEGALAALEDDTMGIARS